MVSHWLTELHIVHPNIRMISNIRLMINCGITLSRKMQLSIPAYLRMKPRSVQAKDTLHTPYMQELQDSVPHIPTSPSPRSKWACVHLRCWWLSMFIDFIPTIARYVTCRRVWMEIFGGFAMTTNRMQYHAMQRPANERKNTFWTNCAKLIASHTWLIEISSSESCHLSIEPCRKPEPEWERRRMLQNVDSQMQEMTSETQRQYK